MSLYVNIQKQMGDFTLDVNFTSDSGVTGLLGASGCGKSMTLKCIAGIERPDRGCIILDGKTLFDSQKGICLPPQERQVGYLFQNYALFPHMTVRQNILCGLHAIKNKSEKIRKYEEWIRLLHLETTQDLRPSQLSGGQAQRTALARILASEPRLLLLDEPFTALDTHLRLALELELNSLLHQLGKETILVTHSRDEAYRLCSHLGVIAFGRLIAMKETKELFENPMSIPVAQMTGCKNIVPVRKAGEYEVVVPSWGELHLRTKDRVGDDVVAIGIRAHDWRPDLSENRCRIRICQEMEEPFENILLFSFENQEDTTSTVWWRYSKDCQYARPPQALGVLPQNIHLLYEN